MLKSQIAIFVAFFSITLLLGIGTFQADAGGLIASDQEERKCQAVRGKLTDGPDSSKSFNIGSWQIEWCRTEKQDRACIKKKGKRFLYDYRSKKCVSRKRLIDEFIDYQLL